MSQNNIESKVIELLEPIIKNLGYDLYDVQYEKDGKDYYLRITIDNQTGISIEDCEKVNSAINDPLDETDFIKDSYILEVSSPGIERNLRKDWHYKKQIGQEISIKLYKPVKGKKEFIGVLEDFDENKIKLRVESEILEIDRKNITVAKKFVKLF